MEDEYTRELRAALVKAIRDRHELEKKLAGAEARVAQLTDILEHQGMLAAGHKRLLERVDQKAQGRAEPRYKLRVINTERAQIVAPAIDCGRSPSSPGPGGASLAVTPWQHSSPMKNLAGRFLLMLVIASSPIVAGCE